MENTPSLDKNYVKGLIQDILNKNHTDVQKREIKEFPERLNFACPICGDSQKNSHKKRGNLYFENMYYKCFNEHECSRSFTKLLNTFDMDMDMEKKLELYDYLDSQIKYHTIANEDTLVDFKRLIPLDDFVNFFQKDAGRNITGMRPLTFSSPVYDYIVNKRGIKNHDDIYEGIYHITAKWKQPVAIFVNKARDRVIGMQTRNLFDGDKRVFKIYDFSQIYDIMYPDNDMDEQERIAYNRISQIYNIFNIDTNRIINVFEGYLDCLSLPNSIGLTGIDTSLSILKEEDGILLRFIYDNDASGFKKSSEAIKEGQLVFLWNKFFIDIAKKQYGYRLTKAKVIEIANKAKDFNKLASFFKKPLYQQFDLDKYFSKDVFDLKYLQPIDKVVEDGKILMPNYTL